MPRIAELLTAELDREAKGTRHRGQLTVYLRLNDIPVPSLYGPTADENPYT